MNLDTVDYGLVLQLPEVINNGWFLARDYTSLSAHGVTDDYKDLSFLCYEQYQPNAD
jgi:hypothetical protein